MDDQCRFTGLNLFSSFIIFLFSVQILFAQNNILGYTNVEKLREMALKYHDHFLRQKTEAIQKAQEEGWLIRQELANGHLIELMRLDRNGLPVYYETENLNAARTVSTDDVWPGGSAGLSLQGSGRTAGEWDGGGVRTTHQELIGRVTQKDTPSSNIDHSTHVAGTILASGVQTNAHGMAPQATLDAYEWNDDHSEMSNAAAEGLLISNHSYGISCGWDPYGTIWYGDENISVIEDYKFGFYSATESMIWDEIAYNAPYYLIVKSAGNDRGHEPRGPSQHERDGGSDGYDCIGPQGVAKNILTIGAIHDIINGYSQSSDVVMSSFSSWGPTDDGRIKPDLVANGISLYSCTASTNTSYAYYDGTSMASPNTTGSLLLIQEHYHNLSGGSFLRAATLKALTIHTADEAGPANGPDYQFGWGLLNTKHAAELISAAFISQDNQTIQEINLMNNHSYSIQVTSNGAQPLRVTIAWTDPPGTPVEPALDPSNIMLINDLDLRITNNSTTYYPWTFANPSPNNPSESATTGDNIRDNAEQVHIANPPSGIYTLTVNHKGTLYSEQQAFSLIMSGAYYSDAALAVTLSSFEISAGNGLALLKWITQSEIDNLGFNILRSCSAEGPYSEISSYLNNTELKGLGTSSQGQMYQYYDFDLKNGQTYWYKIQDVSINGRINEHGPVSIKPDESSKLTKESLFPPRTFALFQNYPNPFNPKTVIRYQLAQDSETSLSVYNLLGQEVATLSKGRQTAGKYDLSWDGSNMPSGIYYYRLLAGKYTEIKSMLLIR